MNLQEWNKWNEKRKAIITEENYAKDSNNRFQDIQKRFKSPKNIKELNPAMKYPGELLEIASGQKPGYYYPSVGHPNFTELENILTFLETGDLPRPRYSPSLFSSLVFPRGMAAIDATLEALAMEQDGVFIYHKITYPSTKKLLGKKSEKINKNFIGTIPGIELDLQKAELLEEKIKELKKENVAVLGVVMEPCCNPTADYIDARAISDIAHKYDIPVIADNTFLTPGLLEPFRMGADIVIHSLTKYYSGQGDLLGGVVIAPNEFIPKIKLLRKEKGFTMSTRCAHEYYKRVLGIQKRILEHSRNAAKIAGELKKLEQISVGYNNLGDKTREGLSGGVFSFVFIGSEDEGYNKSLRFSEYLCKNKGTVKQAVSFAEPKTMVLPWAGQVPDKGFLSANNIPYGLVRVGVGRDNPSKVADYIAEGVEWSCKK